MTLGLNQNVNGNDLLGQVLNERYQTTDVVHIGQNCTVYKALHVLMERTVAIKALHKTFSNDNISVQRMQLEAQAASHLDHQGITRVYDFGFFHTGRPYLVMDYIEGTTLDAIVKAEGPLKADRFRHLFKIICHAMGHAHGMGVVHCDLKPSHIVVTMFDSDKDVFRANPLKLEDGSELPVMVDFRLARFLPESKKQFPNLTQMGEIVGTAEYMSPEHCMAINLDQLSDIYSLGCTMYFALVGEPPFKGTSMIDSMQMHLSQKPDQEKLPLEFRSLVMKCLERKPEARFQSMAEVYKALGGKLA